jgi:peptidoglycan/LPS O-acetylase OafA/YrhL
MGEYENKQLARNVLLFSGLVSYAVFLIVFYYLLQILTIYPTEPKYYGLIIATAVSYAAAFLVLHKLSESLLKLFYIRIKQKQRKIQNDNN